MSRKYPRFVKTKAGISLAQFGCGGRRMTFNIMGHQYTIKLVARDLFTDEGNPCPWRKDGRVITIDSRLDQRSIVHLVFKIGGQLWDKRVVEVAREETDSYLKELVEKNEPTAQPHRRLRSIEGDSDGQLN